jgi:hypothetical protein
VLGVRPAADIEAGLREAGLAEAEFYRGRGLLPELLAANAPE